MAAPLKKSINTFTLTMIAVGACIGSGIFISPSDVASQLSTGTQLLLVWGIGGVVALTGALTFGELASRHPGTGGVYVYLREAYGDVVAFLYGWSILTVITSGAIAALCLAFARYATRLVGWGPEMQIPLALAALLVVTVVNIAGVKYSAWFSSGMTILKIIGIGIVVVVCFALGHSFTAHLRDMRPEVTSISFGVALIGVLWSYGGWHHASYVGGEVHNARKVMPKALLAGALIVTVVYMLVNAAYLSVLPMSAIAASPAVAAEALSSITVTGGVLVAILIAISTFGTAGIYTMSAPRIYFTMGADKVFFPWLADIHTAFGTPMKAILLQSCWAAVLMLFWGTFEKLTTYVVFMDWIFMTLAAIGLFVFRRRHGGPDTSGYTVSLYPLTPLVFIGISIWFLISTLFGRPEQAIAGLILMVAGWPVYYYFRKKNSAKDGRSV